MIMSISIITIITVVINTIAICYVLYDICYMLNDLVAPVIDSVTPSSLGALPGFFLESCFKSQGTFLFMLIFNP